MRKITHWINTRFSVSLKDRDYNVITEFLLLWNLFESKLFENNFTIEKAKNFINLHKKKFDVSICNKVFDYFKKRYTEGDIVIYEYFESLNIRNDEHKKNVDATLVDDSSSHDKMFTLMIIVYRYRNNLFHGLKDVTQINTQRENFIYANEFLKMFIESVM